MNTTVIEIRNARMRPRAGGLLSVGVCVCVCVCVCIEKPGKGRDWRALHAAVWGALIGRLIKQEVEHNALRWPCWKSHGNNLLSRVLLLTSIRLDT